jgi:radical SAM protein with 4Fe4S-binding SPASM domain
VLQFDAVLRRFRYERFGGIVHLERPRALVFVDHALAGRLGYRDPPPWPADPADGEPVVLSAPLEAHLQLTNRCENTCQGCYTGATPQGSAQERSVSEWKRAIDELAEMGVFHLALGGGESGDLPWLGEIAAYARARGLVPNLTTSGQVRDLDALVAVARLFGQINVSIDGIGEVYQTVRGYDGFARADAAVVALRRETRNVGINCVICRPNFDHLAEVFRYARKRRLRSLELLRFKPSGRGAASYQALRATDEQHEALLPTVLGLARRHRVRVRLDCSLVPFVVHHRPNPRLLRWLAVYGCVGGDYLVGAKAHGVFTACSFAAPPPAGPRLGELAPYWRQTDAFEPFRQWRNNPEPCRSCEYLSLCRGGCRVVAAHVTGSPLSPDPECPRVRSANAVAVGASSKCNASHGTERRSHALSIFR